MRITRDQMPVPSSPVQQQIPPHWTQVQVIQQPVVNPQVEAWRAYLQAQRPLQLARLRQYATNGIFPENRVRPGRVNVFIDGNGRLCAFANLLALSGHRALVDQTSQQNNFIRFADVQSGALMAWTLSSGLTREEIIRIQEPYEFIPQGVPQAVEWQAEQQERVRLQTHFNVLINDLEANGDQSINIALSRLGANLATVPHDLSQDYPVTPVVQPVGYPQPVVYPQPVQPVQVVYPTPQPVVVYQPPTYPQYRPYQPYQPQYQRPVRVNPYMANPVVYQPPQQQVVVMQVPEPQVVQVQQVPQQVQQVPQQVQIQMHVQVMGNGIPMGS